MATNKNAQLRYKILDSCLSDRTRSYTFEQLCDTVSEVLLDLYGTDISDRQIREDLKTLRDKPYNAPIEAYVPPIGTDVRGKQRLYRYSDENFSIYKSELTPQETEKLKSVVDMLRRFSGLPNFEWIDDLIIRLNEEFQLSGVTEHIIGFEQNTRLKGLEFLSRLIDLIAHHQAIKVVYHNFRTGLDDDVVLHPYFLKQYNTRWFLFGLNQERNEISNLALDRIVSACTADDIKFVPNTEVDFEHYFDDIVGVTIPKEDIGKEHIVLKFTKKRFPYVTTKPIHASQQTISDEDCTISIDVRPNRELTAQLLSFGPDVEILSPDGVREHISKKIEENFKKYFPVKDDCTGGS